MALALLIAGIFAVVAGLLAIIFGIPVKEFSFGNTLIIVGAMGVCSGLLLTGLFVVVAELKNIARRLGSTAPSEVRVRPVLPGVATVPLPEAAPADKVEPSLSPPPGAPPPWQDEARQRTETPPVPEAPAAPAEPKRRNLLFASTSRKERERAQAKALEALPPEVRPPPAAAAPEPAEAPPATFDDAWPKPDRMRPAEPTAQRRPPPSPEPRPAPPAEQSAVTVLKSGVVDGMAYSLYSDGSIEAQMPEGMMRFASIDELRAHLDQRS
jgi:hypothetical protein